MFKIRFFLIITLLLAASTLCQAQLIKTEAFNGKTYQVYTSLADAFKVNPDSVEGLVLCSNDFKDFPIEILRFKNLKYLNICSSTWSDFKDSLSEQQIRINDSLETKRHRIITYKPNYVISIPRGIKKLKKLELVDFSSAYVSKKAMYQLYKYLPKVERLPDYIMEKKYDDMDKDLK